MSEYIFETVDPLNNIVYLTSETASHIENGHPELQNQIPEIKETVENPDNIYTDKDYHHKCNYYREHSNDDLKQYGNIIKVIVNRDLQGQITTAYIVSMVNSKDTVYFTKSTNE